MWGRPLNLIVFTQKYYFYYLDGRTTNDNNHDEQDDNDDDDTPKVSIPRLITTGEGNVNALDNGQWTSTLINILSAAHFNVTIYSHTYYRFHH